MHHAGVEAGSRAMASPSTAPAAILPSSALATTPFAQALGQAVAVLESAGHRAVTEAQQYSHDASTPVISTCAEEQAELAAQPKIGPTPVNAIIYDRC